MLYQIGDLTIDTTPFNAHKVEREYGGDFAVKDLIGASRAREFSGPADSSLKLEGVLFPYALGGLTELERLEQMAESGEAFPVMRGDNRALGFFVIEKVAESSSYLSGQGVGRRIEYAISMQRAPTRPSASALLSLLMRLIG